MRNLVCLSAAFVITALASAHAEEAGSRSPLLGLYVKIHAALASDTPAGVAEAAAELANIALSEGRQAPEPKPYKALATAALALQGDDLTVLRAQFKVLSKAMATLVSTTGMADTQVYFCSMAGGYWIQSPASSSVENPYYGKEMLKCGSRVDRVDG